MFKNFKNKGNLDVFEEEKDIAIENVLKKINGLPENKKVEIVIFIERYLCKLETFVSRIKRSASEHTVIVSLPVHSSVELNLYVRKLKCRGVVSLWWPTLNSEVITKAQRKFHFSNIPSDEFTNADKMSLPKVSSDINEVTQFLVSQGD